MSGSRQDTVLPPPFVVGQKYLDRDGEYLVLSVEGEQLIIECANGRRTTATVSIRARMHRNILEERARVSRGKPRRGTTVQRDLMTLEILRVESDGEEHTGVAIDQHLRGMARDLGYTERDLPETSAHSSRGIFTRDGDWVKATMTETGLHEIVRQHDYQDEAGQSHRCHVYRITEAGRQELQRRTQTQS